MLCDPTSALHSTGSGSALHLAGSGSLLFRPAQLTNVVCMTLQRLIPYIRNYPQLAFDRPAVPSNDKGGTSTHPAIRLPGSATTYPIKTSWVLMVPAVPVHRGQDSRDTHPSLTGYYSLSMQRSMHITAAAPLEQLRLQIVPYAYINGQHPEHADCMWLCTAAVT